LTISRRAFLQSVGGAAFLLLPRWTPGQAAPAARPRPNLVLIISDDMGYADLPRFGADMEIPMPNIDRLAAAGVTFSDAYVSGPICVPSRMGIVTGRHQARWGVYTNVYAGEPFDGFNKEKTLAEYLKAAGYATALIGKWHLCGNGRPMSGILPDKRGYDEVVIIPGGMSSYWPDASLYRHDSENATAPEYLTDHFGKQAADFIRRQKNDRPFFLHLAFNAVHAPLHALDDDKAAFDEAANADRKTYAGMMRAMDRNIGRVLDALTQGGFDDNTLVVFVNDNGGPALTAAKHSYNQASNAPLRGYKFDCLEGGVRTPMILRWPGRAPAGQTFSGITSSMDVAPTFLAAAGIAPPADRPMDGVDLLPFLTGAKTGDPHASLCWQSFFGNASKAQAAIRRGQWKLWQECDLSDGPAPDRWSLYDLSADIGESKDLNALNPEIVKRLDAEWRAWRARMKNPPAQPAEARAARSGKEK